MALPQVLEGAWEEIKQYEAELMGRRLRVIVDPGVAQIEEAKVPNVGEEAQGEQPAKTLRGYGMFAHVPGGSEEFARGKQQEIQREEGKMR